MLLPQIFCLPSEMKEQGRRTPASSLPLIRKTGHRSLSREKELVYCPLLTAKEAEKCILMLYIFPFSVVGGRRVGDALFFQGSINVFHSPAFSACKILSNIN